MSSDPRQLGDFEGRWTLTRAIHHANGPVAHFVGQAVWTPDADGMIYRETGTLSIAGQPAMQAERLYHWHPDLTVHFKDGRFFHKVPELGGETEHRCAPDSYIVRYDFTAWPQFEVAWHVTGPRKSYSMLGLYTRA